MTETAATSECYKAGAKACGDGHSDAKNPHVRESDEAKMWDDGYLDKQRQHAYRDADLSRKRSMRKFKSITPIGVSEK